MTMETQERTASFFRFEDLRIYAKSLDYCNWIATAMREPRTDVERNLVNTFCRSAYDIALNIAEGSSRSKNQFEHYLKISKTAIRECIVFTELASKQGLISDESKDNSRELLMEMTRMIGALILSLQRGSGRRHDDDSRDNELPEIEEANDDPLDAIDTNF